MRNFLPYAICACRRCRPSTMNMPTIHDKRSAMTSTATLHRHVSINATAICSFCTLIPMYKVCCGKRRRLEIALSGIYTCLDYASRRIGRAFLLQARAPVVGHSNPMLYEDTYYGGDPSFQNPIRRHHTQYAPVAHGLEMLPRGDMYYSKQLYPWYNYAPK